MTNKYLEKIALARDEFIRGAISPAWMEHHIAHKHGKQGPSFGGTAKSELKGEFRKVGRGAIESFGGSLAGMGVGALVSAASKGKINLQTAATKGAIAGSMAGSIHGVYASVKNQSKEHHKKYSKK